MPRRKAAKQEDVERVFVDGFQKWANAPFKAGNRKKIEQHMRDLEIEWHVLRSLLDLVTDNRLSSKHKHAMLQFDRQKVSEALKGLRFRQEDLPVLEKFFDDAAKLRAKGQNNHPPNKALLRLLVRLVEQRTPAPRALKPEFFGALRMRAEANSRGEVLTIQKITQQIWPDRYRDNPESAQRAMARGMARAMRYLREQQAKENPAQVSVV